MLLIAIAWLGYDNYQLKSEERAKEALFAKRTQCINLCKPIYEKDTENNLAAFQPKYAYNPKNNACYYSGGAITEGGSWKRVLNCQTNEEMLTYMYVNKEIYKDCKTCVETETEYEVKEWDYMRQE